MKRVFFLFFIVASLNAMSQIEMVLDTVVHTEKGYYVAFFSTIGDNGDLCYYLHGRPTISSMKMRYGDDEYPQVGDKSFHSSSFPILIPTPALPDFPVVDTIGDRVVLQEGLDPRDILIIKDDTSFFMSDTVINTQGWISLWVINTITGQRVHLSRHTTLIIHDTVHDTVYIGINNIQPAAAKIYQRGRIIVVEGAEGNVTLYDAVGRVLATKNDDYCFEVPAAGVYLIQVGDAPARRIVVP